MLLQFGASKSNLYLCRRWNGCRHSNASGADAWGNLMAGTPQPNTPTTMGKQISVLRIKGSVGEVTGYKMNTSSKTSKSGDFIRSKATSVANPRSYAQAKQRAKARPAQLFYGAFENVLNHAFFPLGKPVKNRNRFLSLAMKLDYVPDVKKSEVKLPFAPYQISEGTLGLDDLCVGSYNAAFDSRVQFVNFIADGSIVGETVASMSKEILDSNPRLMEGEELTFLALLCKADDPSVRWAEVRSVVLDLNNTVTKLNNIFNGDVEFNFSEDNLAIAVKSQYDATVKMLAAGLIISSKTTGSWQYAKSYMTLTTYAIDGFDWNEKDIIVSYMNETRDRNSDKQLQQADNTPAGETVPIASVDNAKITLKQGVTGNLNHNDAANAFMRFGTVRVVVSDKGQLQYYNSPNKTWSPITIGNDDNKRPLVLADTTWAGSQTITVAECQAAGF